MEGDYDCYADYGHVDAQTEPGEEGFEVWLVWGCLESDVEVGQVERIGEARRGAVGGESCLC